jgi:hypothetical protein
MSGEADDVSPFVLGFLGVLRGVPFAAVRLGAIMMVWKRGGRYFVKADRDIFLLRTDRVFIHKKRLKEASMELKGTLRGY